MSTIKQPDNDIARLSFELLQEFFEGKKARHIESSYKFIKGESMAEYEEGVFWERDWLEKKRNFNAYIFITR